MVTTLDYCYFFLYIKQSINVFVYYDENITVYILIMTYSLFDQLYGRIIVINNSLGLLMEKHLRVRLNCE